MAESNTKIDYDNLIKLHKMSSKTMILKITNIILKLQREILKSSDSNHDKAIKVDTLDKLKDKIIKMEDKL